MTRGIRRLGIAIALLLSVLLCLAACTSTTRHGSTRPTSTAVQAAHHVTSAAATPRPQSTAIARPIPTQTPAPVPTCLPVVVNCNPWGFTFDPADGTLIRHPPGNFCAVFRCIASFWAFTGGYVVECKDGKFSHSGGVRGACSFHGGVWRPLYSH